MDLRERFHSRPEQDPASSAPGGDNLDALRSRASHALTAADAVIDRTLSRNSEAFLAANRQQMGE
jgi:hypothetical protein